jgi:hypothetical protein
MTAQPKPACAWCARLRSLPALIRLRLAEVEARIDARIKDAEARDKRIIARRKRYDAAERRRDAEDRS